MSRLRPWGRSARPGLLTTCHSGTPGSHLEQGRDAAQAGHPPRAATPAHPSPESKEKALLGRRGWPKARACITAPWLVLGEMLDPPHQYLPVT